MGQTGGSFLSTLLVLFLQLGSSIIAVKGACSGVLDAAGLTSAVSSSIPNAVVTVCGDIEVTSTIKIAQSVTLVGQCPYPGCRIYSNAQIGTGVQLFQVGNGLGTVTFRNLWLDGGFVQPTFNTAAGFCPGGLTGFKGGAISTGTGTNLVVDSVVFTSNSACASGGAIDAGGNATVTKSLFLNNTAMYGGGIATTSGAFLTVRNSNFSYNSARDRGSALWIYEAKSAAIQGSLFMYNRALGFGGGAVVAFGDTQGTYNGNLIIAGNTFANNTCPVGGGAILNHYSGKMLVTGNLFLQNYAPSGGALYLDHGFTTLVSPNTFLRNQADGSNPRDIFVVGGANSTGFCPPGTLASASVGTDNGTQGTPVATCGSVGCSVTNPCDPAATCTATSAQPVTCTCPSSAPGNGFVCDATLSVMSVGAGTNFSVPRALDLRYGGDVTSILRVIGPSPTGASVVLPPSPPAATLGPNSPPPINSTTTPPGKEDGGSNVGVVVGIIVAIIVVALLIICAIAYWCYRRKKRRQLPLVLEPPKKLDGEWRPSTAASGREAQARQALGRNWRKFTYAELSQATRGFSKEALLGEGAFGQVYLAILPDGTRLAVKQLKDGAKEMGEREFMGELDALGRVRHRNLVSLRGYCVTDHDCFLVLDFADNGNLDAALRSGTRAPLDWDTRLNIAIGAARGLSYLHNDTDPPIIHRDIKSANILLDAKMQAQVADFGLAKLAPDGLDGYSTMVRGTYGYLAPEIVHSGRVTPKSDVYSFGVVLLELMTGRRALESTPDGSKQNLVEAVSRNRHRMLVIMDPALDHRFSPEAATRVITIALSCVAGNDSVRPDMSDVLRALESIARGEVPVADVGDQPKYQDSTIGEPDGWFVASRGDSARSSDLSNATSSLSHSTWTQPRDYSTSGASSINYQMTMIQEGR